MERNFLDLISATREKNDIFYLCRDPLPFRTVLYTIPWHEKNTLDETDDFIVESMSSLPNVIVERQANKIRPFRCDSSKRLHHWYSPPHEDDPWYDANNISVTIPGHEKADEIIQLVSHKDSMSWINSPGAHDNATGTVTNMELARALSQLKLKRTVRILFCNEEHTPWHSRTAAKAAAENGDKIIAVLNQDSIDGKSDEETAAGRKVIVARYSTPEGKELAEYIVSRAAKYDIPIEAFIGEKALNDDDGSFILEGFPKAVMNSGSNPYSDPQYHLAGDTPERVDFENLKLSTQLLLATIVDLSEEE